MLYTLIRRLTSVWTFLRVIRLALALVIIKEAWSSSETLLAIIGSFLMFQAIFNYGCCAPAGCDRSYDRLNPAPKNKTADDTFIDMK